MPNEIIIIPCFLSMDQIVFLMIKIKTWQLTHTIYKVHILFFKIQIHKVKEFSLF